MCRRHRNKSVPQHSIANCGPITIWSTVQSHHGSGIHPIALPWTCQGGNILHGTTWARSDIAQKLSCWKPAVSRRNNHHDTHNGLPRGQLSPSIESHFIFTILILAKHSRRMNFTEYKLDPRKLPTLMDYSCRVQLEVLRVTRKSVDEESKASPFRHDLVSRPRRTRFNGL